MQCLCGSDDGWQMGSYKGTKRQKGPKKDAIACYLQIKRQNVTEAVEKTNMLVM